MRYIILSVLWGLGFFPALMVIGSVIYGGFFTHEIAANAIFGPTFLAGLALMWLSNNQPEDEPDDR